ncbi:host cell division inhibitor Icd-like protein [Escherichia coli]|nr:host cell division inhibitor Icd-like protein [Escherichia coli]
MSDFVLDKTKATGGGRQWENTKHKPEHHSDLLAGGQCVRFAPMTLGLTEGHYGECAGLLVGYSCSLALRRCSYFNLRPQASKTHAEKLALGLVNFSCSTLASIPSISSCGNRMFFFADLLFVFPLDIGTPHLNGFDGRTQYSKKSEKLSIDMCAHMILICAHSLGCIAQIKQRPAVLATHAGRLTTNDRKRIEVAMLNHTTHPQGRDSYNLNKYIWRFIALSTAQPRVIHIEATSEQEARQQSPDGCVMVFAARIRQEVRHD